jgi:5-methyltetrahydrofolate--homocysteine methyltransferase
MKPNFIGQKYRSRFGCLVPYIDWTRFFRTWNCLGNIGSILTDDVVGEQATSVFGCAGNVRVILKERN